MENPIEYETKLKLMQELDFDIALKILWKKIKAHQEKKGWSHTEIGKLVGKERTHVSNNYKHKPDMQFTCFVKYFMACDWDTNALMLEIEQAILNAPRKLK